ncbi:MAG: LysR family transcriptional regulator [Collimonas sp.]|uniref:helix-turn-helix domain-containing protein n=1 Tax=Collimonas sp. TaxID=1963772 RepID=UPI003266D664
MDRLSVMRLFIDASTLGSFSAAGRKHDLSPAASSAAIQRLEATLRVKLFERTTRRLRLSSRIVRQTRSSSRKRTEFRFWPRMPPAGFSAGKTKASSAGTASAGNLLASPAD